MKMIKTASVFVIAAAGLILAGCPNGEPSAEPEDQPGQIDTGTLRTTAMDITSGDSFVGIWQVTNICALDFGGAPKRHHEVGHGASVWGHVNNNSTYAIYKKSGSGASTVYGLMISEEFADYNVANKKTLINWNSAELHFTAGKVHEPAGGDGCLLPGNDIAILQTEISGGGTAKRPQFHPNTEHIVQIWLFKDSSGNVSPQIAFEHGTGVGVIHRGFLH